MHTRQRSPRFPKAIAIATAAGALVSIWGTGTGCTSAVSPPAQLPGAETASPLGAGESAATARSHVGIGAAGAAVGGRHGVGERLDMDVQVTGAAVAGGEVSGGFAGRAGGRWAPDALRDHLALTFGMGGGHWDGGSFVSPDAGLALSREVWQTARVSLVPVATTGGFVSVPIDAREVQVLESWSLFGENEYRPDTPETTAGLNFALGLTADIQLGGRMLSPHLGLSAATMSDDGWSNRTGTLGFDAGFAMTF